MLSVDTVKMNKCGQEIIDTTRDINDVLDDLFLKIEKMPISTREWVGDSAINFSKTVVSQKGDYIKFLNSLNNLGKILIKNANSYDKTTSNILNKK